jgi:hypothetical protein
LNVGPIVFSTKIIRQLVSELALSCSQLALSALKESEAKPPLISLDGYRDLRPLNQDIIAIIEPAMSQGLIVVELCGEILSATEAIVRTRIKIQQLYVCEIDPEARALAAARLEVLSKMFPELLPSEAFFFVFFIPATRNCIDQTGTYSAVGSCRLDHLRVSMSRFF